jgi:RHS repeat-associated protein
VSVTPYLVFHQNWANYVEPIERVTSPQGQLSQKPWAGVKKWAVTVPAAQNGAPLTHADLRLVGTGPFNLGSVVLRRVTPPQEINVYDADGARMVRRDPNGTSTVFLDGQEVVYNSGVNTVVSASRYYAGSSTLAVRSTTNGLTYLGADHQGTIMATLTTGGVSTRQRYKPYGSQRGTSNALTTERGFIGQVEDTAIGLVYLNARHYDPTNGVFVSVDPLPTGYPYLYGNGNPVVLSDPFGRCAECGAVDWTKVSPEAIDWFDNNGPAQVYYAMIFDSIVELIAEEIAKNVNDRNVEGLRADNCIIRCGPPLHLASNPAGAVDYGLRFKNIVNFVKTGGKWDHKGIIDKLSGFKDWIDSGSGYKIRWDVFSNFHYGYIFAAMGFNLETALAGSHSAPGAGSGSKRDQLSDDRAIRLGYDACNCRGLFGGGGPNKLTGQQIKAILLGDAKLLTVEGACAPGRDCRSIRPAR